MDAAIGMSLCGLDSVAVDVEVAVLPNLPYFFGAILLAALLVLAHAQGHHLTIHNEPHDRRSNYAMPLHGTACGAASLSRVQQACWC